MTYIEYVDRNKFITDTLTSYLPEQELGDYPVEAANLEKKKAPIMNEMKEKLSKMLGIEMMWHEVEGIMLDMTYSLGDPNAKEFKEIAQGVFTYFNLQSMSIDEYSAIEEALMELAEDEEAEDEEEN